MRSKSIPVVIVAAASAYASLSCGAIVNRMRLESNPIGAILQTQRVLDPGTGFIIDSVSLLRAIAGDSARARTLISDAYVGARIGHALPGKECGDRGVEKCVGVFLLSWSEESSAIRARMKWVPLATRACTGFYSATYQLSRADGAWRVVNETDKEYGDCGAPEAATPM